MWSGIFFGRRPFAEACPYTLPVLDVREQEQKFLLQWWRVAQPTGRFWAQPWNLSKVLHLKSGHDDMWNRWGKSISVWSGLEKWDKWDFLLLVSYSFVASHARKRGGGWEHMTVSLHIHVPLKHPVLSIFYQEVLFLNVHWHQKRGNPQWLLSWHSYRINMMIKVLIWFPASLFLHLQKELLSSFVPSMVPSGSIWR